MEEAYGVGQRLHALRVARGERLLGWKIGFTNRSIWARYGVYAPIWGPVWDTTAALLDGSETTLSLAGLSVHRHCLWVDNACRSDVDSLPTGIRPHGSVERPITGSFEGYSQGL